MLKTLVTQEKSKRRKSEITFIIIPSEAVIVIISRRLLSETTLIHYTSWKSKSILRNACKPIACYITFITYEQHSQLLILYCLKLYSPFKWSKSIHFSALSRQDFLSKPKNFWSKLWKLSRDGDHSLGSKLWYLVWHVLLRSIHPYYGYRRFARIPWVLHSIFDRQPRTRSFCEWEVSRGRWGCEGHMWFR